MRRLRRAIFVGGTRLARTLLAAVLGVPAAVLGLLSSVPHTPLRGAGGSDDTGVPAINAGVATHGPRPAVPSATTLGLAGARDVVFAARDGVRLSGWYVPGHNGAAVILAHGSHDPRVQTLGHLRMLPAAGYAVLAYDARGHGASAGQTNALGWRGGEDIAGAVAFLRRQPGVNAHAIAALGLSMGAEEALRAAAAGAPIRRARAGAPEGDPRLGRRPGAAHRLQPPGRALA